MLLEMIKPHPKRDDTYLNKIIIPHGFVPECDKLEIRKILLKELREIKIIYD